jgi:hypothetical protein
MLLPSSLFLTSRGGKKFLFGPAPAGTATKKKSSATDDRAPVRVADGLSRHSVQLSYELILVARKGIMRAAAFHGVLDAEPELLVAVDAQVFVQDRKVVLVTNRGGDHPPA